jgi:hypothetical protein
MTKRADKKKREGFHGGGSGDGMGCESEGFPVERFGQATSRFRGGTFVKNYSSLCAVILSPCFYRLLIFICCLALSASGAERKPNIVDILVDDMGWSDIGCYGSEIPDAEPGCVGEGWVAVLPGSTTRGAVARRALHC